MARAKGSVLIATCRFLEEEGGESLLEEVLGRLAPEERRRVEAAEPTDEVPFTLPLALWEAADAVLGREDPGWMERAGAFSIEGAGRASYAGILRKESPRTFLTQPVSLFRLYYHGGDMEVVRQEPGHVVLRLVGFDEAALPFCRRQTGGLRRALELAGGRDTAVEHVRCAVEGDAFCEWDLRWKEESADRSEGPDAPRNLP